MQSAVRELEVWRSNILVGGPDGLKPFLSESTEYEAALWEERQRFESDTVEPIWSLRVDLKGWTEGRRKGGGRGAEGGLSFEERQSILEQLDAVKEQQARIQGLLRSEWDLLSADLEVCAAM